MELHGLLLADPWSGIAGGVVGTVAAVYHRREVGVLVSLDLAPPPGR